jgi:hypothetical protein
MGTTPQETDHRQWFPEQDYCKEKEKIEVGYAN